MNGTLFYPPNNPRKISTQTGTADRSPVDEIYRTTAAVGTNNERVCPLHT